MKKFISGSMFLLSLVALKVNAAYVLPADVDAQGTLRGSFCLKGYVFEALPSYWQKDVAFIYGVKWVPIKNLEVGANPPIVRYHYGKGGANSCYTMGLGDMDIGWKYAFLKNVAVQNFFRIPTGAQDLPLTDDWCPKFSTGKIGVGVKAIYSQPIIKDISAHLNIDWLYNIGSGDTIPTNRIPLGIRLSLPFGIFMEGTVDMLPYGDIGILNTPKRAVLGVEYKTKQDINLLASFEYGTWGTGEPPMHVWHYGFIEDAKPWDVTVGVSFPLSCTKTQPTVIAGIMEGKLINKVTNLPIKGVINIKKIGLSVNTDENGNYKLFLPTGQYAIVISMMDYETEAQDIEIVNGETKKVDFMLTPVK
ncbi:MAG: carboxypeptidase-like regulatory domain-containing protein [bacterium]|nr:carboxypeptidase-like regulatory domain-containing protein [bacterium]